MLVFFYMNPSKHTYFYFLSDCLVYAFKLTQIGSNKIQFFVDEKKYACKDFVLRKKLMIHIENIYILIYICFEYIVKKKSGINQC